MVTVIKEKELIHLKREAKLKGGFYVEPEAKLLFIIRIRGYVFVLAGFNNITIRSSLSFWLYNNVTLWTCQDQCNAPENKKDPAALASETGKVITAFNFLRQVVRYQEHRRIHCAARFLVVRSFSMLLLKRGSLRL